MSELTNLPDERPQDEKFQPLKEDVSENIFPAQSIGLIEPVISNGTPPNRS